MPEPDVVVDQVGSHIVINLPQTELFLYDGGVRVKSWPVAVGKMLTKTPTGDFEITGIQYNPTWHVPKSIQREMRAKGGEIQTNVPPGRGNPLGKVFMRFGDSAMALGIHGTNMPSSVPGFRSHGCIRMKNPDALELSEHIEMGTLVTIAYQTIVLNKDNLGNLWITAYPDRYRRDDVSPARLQQVLLDWQREHNQSIDRQRVDEIVARREGKPVCLTCQPGFFPSETRQWVAIHWLTSPLENRTDPPNELAKQEASSQAKEPVGDKVIPLLGEPAAGMSSEVTPVSPSEHGVRQLAPE